MRCAIPLFRGWLAAVIVAAAGAPLVHAQAVVEASEAVAIEGVRGYPYVITPRRLKAVLEGLEDVVEGNDGWSPQFAVVSDSARRVLQVVDWTGGEGTKPTTGLYVGASGLTATIGDAVDIRGPAGATGAAGENGTNGTNGEDGASAYVYIGYASDDQGSDFTLAFDDDLDWIAVLATTEEIESPAVGDFAGLWKNYRGPQGEAGSAGAPGSAGANGATWHYLAAGTPNDEVGEDGDFLFRAVDDAEAPALAGSIYQRTAGTWGSPVLSLSQIPALSIDSLGVERIFLLEGVPEDDPPEGSISLFADEGVLYVRDHEGTDTALGAGGSGAPTDAPYFTASSVAGLSAEVNLGALTTGLLKLTVADGTATPSTAVAGTDYLTPTGSAAGLTSFPTLNQDTTGSAATLTTSRNLWGVGFNGSANIGGPIELGTAGTTDTTLDRSAAGRASIEGVNLVSVSSTDTLTNKRITARVGTTTSSATPTINTDNVDIYSITAQAAAITSMTTNLTGTPANGDQLQVRITDNGTARAITWGASFGAGPVALPTTTVISKTLRVYFEYDSVRAVWVCMYAASDV